MVFTGAQVNIDKEAEDTGTLILFLDKLFDSLNSSKRFGPPGKPLKNAVTANSNHFKFWGEALDIIKTMQFYCPNRKKFVAVPSLKNLIHSLKGFIYFSHKIFEIYKNKFILTRVLQQDSLENFFSCIRSYSGRENNPSVEHFQNNFKGLIVNNFFSTHSPSGNCEEDENDGPLYTLRDFLLKEVLPEGLESRSLDLHQIEIPPAILLPGRSKIAKCTLNYISGFIVRKVLKFVKCENCKKNLLFRDSNLDLDFIEAREYQNCRLIIPGTYLNFLVSQSITRIFYILPRLCHYSNISLTLKKNLLQNLQFSLINCTEHKSTSSILMKIVIKCCIFFWCRRVNMISKGRDSKFVKFLNMKPSENLVDPIKLRAHKKYLNKVKKKKNSQ